MSLLQDAMESCTIYNKSMIDDGYGGTINTYTPGIQFQAAIVVDDSIQAQIAMASTSIGNYTVTTRRNVNLQFHDVFRRNSDGKIFRVLNDGDDKKTPDSANLNMRQVKAKEWRLPNG